MQISLPLTREVAKRSFDGGRERGKSLKDALRPLSLSLADAWQLPRQREPRKQKRLFSRRSQESENIRLAEKPILILTNFPYFLQKLLTQALGYAKITKKVNIVLLPAGKKKTPADLLSWNSTSPDKLCANTHNYQPDFRHRREASITYLTKHCKCYTSF